MSIDTHKIHFYGKARRFRGPFTNGACDIQEGELPPTGPATVQRGAKYAGGPASPMKARPLARLPRTSASWPRRSLKSKKPGRSTTTT
jgi:hypothetical protein